MNDDPKQAIERNLVAAAEYADTRIADLEAGIIKAIDAIQKGYQPLGLLRELRALVGQPEPAVAQRPDFTELVKQLPHAEGPPKPCCHET